MAKIFQAVREFGPGLEFKPTVSLEAVSEWMAMRTGLNKSEVMMALQEQSEAILFFTKTGTPVKLPGVGTFTPSIDRDGVLILNFRADMELKNAINNTNAYTGEIIHKTSIGMTDEEYKQIWDSQHPTDPLEI